MLDRKRVGTDGRGGVGSEKVESLDKKVKGYVKTLMLE